MLYLIGGASRAGKTMVAERILQQDKIAYLSLDWLMMGFTEGLPQYGIHDQLMPEEIAKKLWSFLKPILENMVWSGIDYVVEGEAILPELIGRFMEENRGKAEVCFLGYTSIDVDQKLREIRIYSFRDKDWLTKEDDNYIYDHLQNMIRHSILIEKGCETYGFRYFDTSEDFLSSVKDAIRYLMRTKHAL
jgi:2-phosphoglycerate kinase